MNKLEIKKPKFVKKEWGHELWIHNEEAYCGKLLVFNKDANFSLHFHMIKEETWYISKGEFEFIYINGETTKKHKETLVEGNVIHILPGQTHQLKALTQGATVFEISTQHFDYDSYRITRKYDEEL
jgi:quercetin dioxygenase-like cupin family protein